MKKQEQQAFDIIQESFNSLPFQPLFQQQNLNCTVEEAFKLLPPLTEPLSEDCLAQLRVNQEYSNTTNFINSGAMLFEPFVPIQDVIDVPQTQCFKTKFKFGQREQLEQKEALVNKQIAIRYGIDMMSHRIGLASLIFAIKEQIKLTFKQGKPSKELEEDTILLDDSDREVNREKLVIINQKIKNAGITMMQYLQQLIFLDPQDSEKMFCFRENVDKYTIDDIIQIMYKYVDKNSLYLLRTVVSPKMQSRNQIQKLKDINDSNVQATIRPLVKEFLRLIKLSLSGKELYFTDDEVLRLNQKNIRHKQQAFMQDQLLKKQVQYANDLYIPFGQIYKIPSNEQNIDRSKIQFAQQTVAAPHPRSIPPPDSNLYFYNNKNQNRDITQPVYNLQQQPPQFFLNLTKKFTNFGVQLSYQKRAIYYNSQSHGYGLFPLQQVAKKEIISEYAGELISTAQSELRDKWYQKNGFLTIYMFSITDQDCIDASFVGNYGRFMNHSCTNTAASTQIVKNEVIHKQYNFDQFQHMYDDDSDYTIGIDIVSQKKIELGEEATQNYNMDEEPYDKKIICNCQSKNCCGLMN